LPDTRLTIGLEGSTLEPNGLAFLISNRPSFADSLFHSVVHSGLFKYDNQNGNLLPVLAAEVPGEWVNENDNWTLSVELIPGLVWSDGKPITTDDVKFSFDLLQGLAQMHWGVNREILRSASIEEFAPNKLHLTIHAQDVSNTAALALLTFPVLQKDYWEDQAGRLFDDEASAAAEEIDFVISERMNLEQEVNALSQEISDARIQLSIKQSKLGDYLKFLNDKKTPANLNGVKDGEAAVTALRSIPGLQSDIALLQETLETLSARSEELHSQMGVLISRHTDLLDSMVKLTEKAKLSLSKMDMESEPLSIPYRLHTIAANQVDLQAVSHQGSRPNYLAFQFMPGDKLLQSFQEGKLDAVYPENRNGILDGLSFMDGSEITALVINPLSTKLADPAVSQAIACIYSSPDLWEDTPLTGTAILKAYNAPPESQFKQPGCTGSLRTRQLNMRLVLSQRYFTWKFLKDGSIIPGSMIDPGGHGISPLSLAVDPDIELNPEVSAKLVSSLKSLGIDVIISQPPMEDTAAKESADLTLTHWKTNLPAADHICSLAGTQEFFRFPVRMQTALHQFCVLSSVETPGDIYSQYSWILLLTGVDTFSYWDPATLEKYDLDWLVPLTPSWVTVW
jgi:hypothetical protein